MEGTGGTAWPGPRRCGGYRRDRKAGRRGTQDAVPVAGKVWPDNEQKRRSKLAARTARGADGSRAAHGAARPHSRARIPENPRVHKQQPAPHSNT